MTQDLTPSPIHTCEIYVDGSSNFEGSGIGIVIASPEGVISKCTLCFKFLTINNESKYKAIIAGLEAAKELEYGT